MCYVTLTIRCLNFCPNIETYLPYHKLYLDLMIITVVLYYTQLKQCAHSVAALIRLIDKIQFTIVLK